MFCGVRLKSDGHNLKTTACPFVGVESLAKKIWQHGERERDGPLVARWLKISLFLFFFIVSRRTRDAGF